MRRVVLFKRKVDSDIPEFTAALAKLKTLDQRMSGMTTWWLQMNIGNEGMWDAALVADFDDLDALRAYESDQEHVKAATSVAAVSEFAVFDSAD